MDIALLVIAFILMLIGIIGCIVPGLPGTPIAYVGLWIAQAGDITRDGEPEAHTLVSNSLLALQQAGIPSIVIPGNHDNTSGFTPTAVEPIKGLTVLSFYDGVSLDWLAEQADAAVAKGNTVIAMTHRQLIDHFDGKGTQLK